MNSIARTVQFLIQDLKFFLQGPKLGPQLAVVAPPAQSVDGSQRGTGFSDILEELKSGILWAVPKRRRSLERRRWRRISMPQYACKPRRDLKTCVSCGSIHEAHTLCGKCYEKIRVESEAIKKAMKESFGVTEISEDVIVRYEDDGAETGDLQGKRVINMPTQRPKFFSKNLLQKGTR